MALSFAAQPVPLAIDADGVVRVGGTRVTLDTVVGAFNDGATAEEIALRYDSLRLPDVYAVIGFYLKNRPDVHEYLEERRRQAEAAHAKMGSLHDLPAIRKRLLGRAGRLAE